MVQTDQKQDSSESPVSNGSAGHPIFPSAADVQAIRQRYAQLIADQTAKEPESSTDPATGGAASPDAAAAATSAAGMPTALNGAAPMDYTSASGQPGDQHLGDDRVSQLPIPVTFVQTAPVHAPQAHRASAQPASRFRVADFEWPCA